MNDFFVRLKQRKLVQWAIAYMAFAFAVIQVLDAVADNYAWLRRVMPIVFGVLALGFVVMLVFAWYHGERGLQRLSGGELLIVALLLAIGGGLLWHFARPGTAAAPGVKAALAQHAAGTSSATSESHGRATKVAAARSTAGVANAISAPPIPAASIPAKSVAVLPFENLSADKNNAYFADGMQDLILTKLADIGDLKVISRTSTEQYGSHPGNLRKIARELGVATVLEGSVQKSGKQVLINVQLINARTDAHIWAKSYQRTLDDIFGVEGEVAQKVADALKAKLTAQETAAVARIPTTNPQAYTAYLKGQYEFNQFFSGNIDPKHLSRAAHFFKQAIANDPRFALAYVWLSTTESAMWLNGWQGDASVKRAMLDNARKALSLQPDLAQAHGAVGWATFVNDPAHADEAIRQIRESIQLAPGGFLAYTELAQIHAVRGQWQSATRAFRKALHNDPRNTFSLAWLATIEARLRHYAVSQQMTERCLAIRPDDAACRITLGDVYFLLGQTAAARAQFNQLPDKFKYPALARVWWMERDYVHALKAAQRIPKTTSGTQQPDSIGLREGLIGATAMKLGDKTRGRAALTRGRADVLAALKAHPDAVDLCNHLARIEMWLGNRNAALRTIQKAISQASSALQSGRVESMSSMEEKAEIMAHFGDAGGATAILRKLLDMPDSGLTITPALLKLDPSWDPIRKDPRFQALLKKYGQTEPAAAVSQAGHG